METGLSQIARLVTGQIVGDSNLRISGINTIDDAQYGELAFVTSPQFYKKAAKTLASAILAEEVIPNMDKTFLLVKNARLAMAEIVHFFHPQQRPAAGIDPRAAIGADVVLGEGVFIGPHVVVSDGVKIADNVELHPGVVIGRGSEIGEQSRIYPHVTLYDGVKIGKRVIIHSGSVIGADGFGFTPHQSRHVKIPQVGNVEIEDDVELGANVTVDRATLGTTRIGAGTKVDNQVHIGHNVKIGPHTLIVAQVGIAGSVSIGHHVILAGQVGVVDHVEIGDHAVVGARSVVTKDIPAHAKVAGFPPLPHKDWLLAQASFQRLPELREEVKMLNQKITDIERRLAQ